MERWGIAAILGAIVFYLLALAGVLAVGSGWYLDRQVGVELNAAPGESGGEGGTMNEWEKEARALLVSATWAIGSHGPCKNNSCSACGRTFNAINDFPAKPREPEIPQDVARDAVVVAREIAFMSGTWAERNGLADEHDLARSVVERMEKKP